MMNYDLCRYRAARAAKNNLLSDYNLTILTIRQQNKDTKGQRVVRMSSVTLGGLPPLDITADECQKKGSPSLNGPLSRLINLL